MADELPALIVPIDGDISGFQKSMGGLKEAMGAVGIMAATFLVSAIESASKYNDSVDLLKTKLANTGVSSATASAGIDKFTSGVEAMSTYTKQDAVSALDNLVTKHVSLSEALKMQYPMTELAAGANISLTQASSDLANAENGRWMTLEKLGIVTKAQVKDGISMSTVLKDIDSRYKNLAQEKEASLPGQIALITRNFSDLKEGIGNALLPVITKVASIFGGLSTMMEKVSPSTKKLIADVLLGVAVFGTLVGGMVIFQKVTALLGPTMEGLGKAIAGSIWPILAVIAVIALFAIAYKTNFGGFRTFVNGVIKDVLAMFDNLVKWFHKNLPTMKTDFGDAMKGIQSAYNTYLKPVVSFMIASFTQILTWVQKNWKLIKQTIVDVMTFIWNCIKIDLDIIKTLWSVFGGLITTIVETAFNVIKTVISTAIIVVEDIISVVMDVITGKWGNAWNGLINIIKTILGGIWGVISDLFAPVIKFFTGLVKTAISWGSNMINSIITGIETTAGDLGKTVENLVNMVITKFKHFFGIKSPSTVMHSIGGHIMQGLINGMGSKDLVGFAGGMMSDLKNAFNGLFSIFSGGSADGSTAGIGIGATNQIKQAMKMLGVPDNYLGPLETIVQHESGGSQTIVNDWDSNAKAGHPSQGLFQMIPSTFLAHMVSGYGNIDNGLDQALSAIKYMISRYGSISAVPGLVSLAKGGPYIGYSAGTLNATSGMHMFGENGPELGWSKSGDSVLNTTNTKALLNIPGVLQSLTSAIKNLGNQNNGRGITINGGISLLNQGDQARTLQQLQFLSQV